MNPDELLKTVSEGDIIVFETATPVERIRTACLLSVAASKSGRKVMLFSNYSPAADIPGKIFSIASGIDENRMASGNLDDSEINSLWRELRHISEFPILIKHGDVGFDELTIHIQEERTVDLVIVENICRSGQCRTVKESICELKKNITDRGCAVIILELRASADDILH